MTTLRPAFAALLSLLLCLTPALPALRAAEPAGERPNILLILSDDHSAPHVGCYGNPDIHTPNLDRFASEGMRLDRAYVTCPQCVPSRASLFTGRSPVAIAMTRFSAPLPREIPTYPEHLRRAGWFTGVAGRNYHMEGSAATPETKALYEKHKLVTFPDRVDYVQTTSDNGAALNQFREFLNRKPSEKPFFLQLCSNDPHRSLTTKGPIPHDPAKIQLPAHYPDTAAVRADFAAYYDEISHFDVFFGQVMEELERRGLAQNTLVAFMGDNGCSQFRGKGTLYEFGVHVPLLVRWPGKIAPGSHSAQLVSGEDLAPTFLSAAGLPVPPEMTGKSFLNLLTGKSFEGRKFAFAERGAHGSALPIHSQWFDLGRVVISDRYKLIYNVTWQLPYTPVDFSSEPFWKEIQTLHTRKQLPPEIDQLYFAPTRPMFELFDLQSDPAELHNRIGDPAHAAAEKELKAALQEWMLLERDFVPLPIQPARYEKKGEH
jgi:N-sulfoglucosamine sulfohydrolase